jgi:subtilisin-like proprotein convertase family protein
VTPQEEASGDIGIGLNTPSGPARFCLDAASARHLGELLLRYLNQGTKRTGVQAEISSGKWKPDGSPQEGQSEERAA